MLKLPRSIYQEENSFWPDWLKWCPSSIYLAIHAETRLLNRVNSVKEIILVPVLKNKYFIRTLYVYRTDFKNTFEREEYINNTPIVLIHGMGAGLAFWCKNIDSFAEYRQVYAIDLIGFGNSSRPLSFGNSHIQVENMFVRSIEDWRNYLELKKLIIVGHSLGGYIACSYGIKYGNIPTHIILVDPWGFREYKSRNMSIFCVNWTYSLLNFLFKLLNPLFPIRLFGPFGPYLVKCARQDLGTVFKPIQVSLKITLDGKDLSNNKSSEKISETTDSVGTEFQPNSQNKLKQQGFLLNQTESDFDAIYDYVYHCNTKRPSGEAAYKCLSSPIGWAVRPLIKRINDLNSRVVLTFIYGGKSWMDWQTGYEVQHLRLNSTVNVKVLDDAGHHVYAEASDDFNKYVNSICL